MESNNNNIESKKRSLVAQIYETVEEHPEPIDADVTGIKELLEFTFQCLSLSSPCRSQSIEYACSGMNAWLDMNPGINAGTFSIRDR